MASDPQPLRAITPGQEIAVIAYNVSTTSVVSGLPTAYKEQLLRDYRTEFHAAAHNPSCQTYDLSCQYLKNLHEVQQVGSHTDSDSDSIISSDSDSGPPPLEDAAPSAPCPHAATVSTPATGVPDGEGVERVWGSSGWGTAPHILAGTDGFIPARWAQLDGEPFENAWAALAPLWGLLRREGLGDALSEKKYSCCQKPHTAWTRKFRCRECGVFTQCLDCVLSCHALHPLHRLQEWKGDYWMPTTLASLGSVYQLGHGGHPCSRPAPVARKMVVMDTNCIHTIQFRYCACDKSDKAQNLEQLLRNDWYPATTVDPATCATFASLEHFRLLNVVGNVNVHDFVRTLEQESDAGDVEGVPDRYKVFGLMARQFACLTRLKQAGRAHDPAGVDATKNGECGVMCWTCPHDGINLPEGWREVSAEFRYLYMLLLAMDANFRLRNRLRANALEDPPLGSGWGYMVEEGPYKNHLKNYVAEKDVSTCIAFAALLQKDTRMTTGLRCSGVGGVVCARHELVRPQGLGDLQKGERYANMDYILLSAIMGVTAMYLAISYDIACQWKINFLMRMAAFPDAMQVDLAATKVLYGLPVWHAAAHERKCQVNNSLNYMTGVGRTDGEGIERTWSVLNPLGWATKEMGGGTQADAIEDKVDHHNYSKNINQGTTLPRKLILAIDERDWQVAAFKEVDSTLKKELKKSWQKKIDEWKDDPTKPNPYELEGGKEGGPSEAAIRLALTKDEAEEAATGGKKLHGSSVTSFIAAGLQLEEAQRRIKREVKQRTLIAADQSERLAEMRVAFFSKLARFHKLQEVYMGAAVWALEAEEDRRDAELPPPKAEDVKLFLPSELQTEEMEEGCRKGLPTMEGRLREGQCRDALVQLRSRLHAKRHLITFRNTEVVGQRASTRAHTLIERVDAAAAKYQRARDALIALRGRAACEDIHELKAADIQLDEEREADAKARKKLGAIGSSKWRQQGMALLSRDRRLSWIWTEGGGPGVSEQELHDSVRVEWSKAKARKERWEEEVELLREEMKRVLRFLRWRGMWWETRRGIRREGVPAEVVAGLQAYAARQASIHREITRRFKRMWDTSAATAVRMAVHEDEGVAAGMTLFASVSGDSESAVAGGSF
ncbi:hypothetical protein DFH07DRAFT_963653 [Mycena maculata]|uniref:CxC2-like cysteine cluster KDZ transposase-associated domain-containing protein n=1 Tax=Mycena maculata TaxID=230809 RepID=A0AAD7N380_9AGAR|nr:hypothetical protein DFH07DRAFT_963653 [Mycena maculata]